MFYSATIWRLIETWKSKKEDYEFDFWQDIFTNILVSLYFQNDNQLSTYVSSCDGSFFIQENCGENEIAFKKKK